MHQIEEKKIDYDENFEKMDPEIKKYCELGNKGIEFYKLKNFSTAKILLFQSLEGLIKLGKNHQSGLLTERCNYFFYYAEESKKQYENIYKIDPNDQNIKVIKETILDQKLNIKFEDIIGLEEIKEIFSEILILPNLRPDLFTGIRSPPKGILMYGPPGNGKTLLAKAIASECKATFFNISASTLVSKYLGDSEKLMRALFLFALSKQPSIIFIDEVDSILTSRNENEHEASRRLKTEFLLQFDGLGNSDFDKITVIGATNRPQEIDPAALRRFTKRVYIGLPSQETRKKLVKDLLKDVKYKILAKEFNEISALLVDYSCSDIKAVIKEACMQPLRELNKKEILEVNQDSIRAINKDDMVKAIKNVQPSLKKKDLLFYAEFEKKIKI